MLILHIITGLDNGGAEATLYRLCSAPWAEGDRHIVVSMQGRGIYADKLEAASIPVYCLDMPRGKLTLSGLLQLWHLLRQIKPDIVQTWMYHADLVGGVVARLQGIRSVFWGIRHANLDPDKNQRNTLMVVRVCSVLSGIVPRFIISCSVAAEEVHKQVGYAADKFIVIPNGYNLSNFTPSNLLRNQARHELGIPEGIPVLGMVARHDPQKDHANLFAALSILKSRGLRFLCILTGTGMAAENHELADQINRLGIGDTLLLTGPRNDIPAIMNALDIHVLSSAGEAFPNVLCEAMAAGIPCVSTDVGDAALIIGETGWHVPARSPEWLAQAIEGALSEMQSDAVLWQLRKEKARQRIVENFSLGIMINRYQQAWLQACPYKRKN